MGFLFLLFQPFQKVILIIVGILLCVCVDFSKLTAVLDFIFCKSKNVIILDQMLCQSYQNQAVNPCVMSINNMNTLIETP